MWVAYVLFFTDQVYQTNGSVCMLVEFALVDHPADAVDMR